MADFFQQLQDSDFGMWVSTSPSLLAYPTILMLHTVGLAMVVGANAVLDLRVLGAGRRIPLDALRPVFPIMAFGFVINASTGLTLFISEAADKGTAPIFWIKLSVIAAALIVALGLRRVLFGRARRDGEHARDAGMKGLAVLSLVLWLGAIFAGRLMAYVR